MDTIIPTLSFWTVFLVVLAGMLVLGFAYSVWGYIQIKKEWVALRSKYKAELTRPYHPNCRHTLVGVGLAETDVKEGDLVVVKDRGAERRIWERDLSGCKVPSGMTQKEFEKEYQQKPTPKFSVMVPPDHIRRSHWFYKILVMLNVNNALPRHIISEILPLPDERVRYFLSELIRERLVATVAIRDPKTKRLKGRGYVLTPKGYEWRNHYKRNNQPERFR